MNSFLQQYSWFLTWLPTYLKNSDLSLEPNYAKCWKWIRKMAVPTLWTYGICSSRKSKNCVSHFYQNSLWNWHKSFFFCIIEINHNAFWAVKSIKLWSKAISKAVKKRFTNPFLSCHNFSYAHLYKIIIHFYACWLLCFFNNNINSEKSASHIYCSLPKIVRTLVYLMYITRRLYTNYSTHT